MKILHIINGLGDGGAEAVLYRLCASDRSNTHAVISLTDEGKYGRMLRALDVEVHSLDMDSVITLGRKFYALYRLVKVIKPDVIQTWMYHANLVGGLAARLSGIERVYWGIHHSNLTPGTVKRSTGAVARIGAIFSRFIPKAIVSCSHEAAKVHQHLGYDSNRFSVIGNGYDLDRFSRDSRSRGIVRTEWGIPDDAPLIGMVARFDPQKDHKNLFAALEIVATQFPTLKCVLIGAGMEASNTTLIHELVTHELADRIILAGQRNDIPAVMNALDIHVLSSLGEAFPNVLAEAMACGTPCVTTDVGDAGLIVGPTGWVVPPGEPAQLGNSILAAIAAMQVREEWDLRQAQCRQRVAECFSIERMVDLYRHVWTA